MSGRKPTHTVTMRMKGDKGANHDIGVAWEIDGYPGALAIKLNNGVRLSWRDCEDYMIGVWPKKNNRPVEGEVVGPVGADEQDITF